MTSYVIKAGCNGEDRIEEEEIVEEIAGPENEETLVGVQTLGEKVEVKNEEIVMISRKHADLLTLWEGCPRKSVKHRRKKSPLKEDEVKKILAHRVELAQERQRKTQMSSLKGRMAYLRTTHYNSKWRETGEIPPVGRRGDAGDFHLTRNIASGTSITGLNRYIPPIGDLSQRADSYLAEHNILFLFQEMFAEMVIRRPTSPRDFLVRWLRKVRGPIEKATDQQSTASSASIGSLCASCCRLVEGGAAKTQASESGLRIELCDCQHSYEDLRSDTEKRKDVPLQPKLVDPQEWMWMESVLIEEEEEAAKEKARARKREEEEEAAEKEKEREEARRISEEEARKRSKEEARKRSEEERMKRSEEEARKRSEEKRREERKERELIEAEEKRKESEEQEEVPGKNEKETEEEEEAEETIRVTRSDDDPKKENLRAAVEEEIEEVEEKVEEMEEQAKEEEEEKKNESDEKNGPDVDESTVDPTGEE